MIQWGSIFAMLKLVVLSISWTQWTMFQSFVNTIDKNSKIGNIVHLSYVGARQRHFQTQTLTASLISGYNVTMTNESGSFLS